MNARSWIAAPALALWATVAGAQMAPPACNDGKCIQVGSYNIELLGSARRPYEGIPRGKRSEQELSKLAATVTTSLDLEAVVFEEINTASEEWARLRELLHAANYDFFEGTTSARNQFVVLAWDADEVAVVEAPRELSVDADFDYGASCREKELRRPVAGLFRAGSFDFWLVGVHLKSRSGETSCTSRIRTAQCGQLVTAIDGLVASSGEHDVLIVGDFNENPGHASLQPLADAGFTSQMQYLIPGSAAGSYVKNGDLQNSTDLIDQILVRYGETRELVNRSACVMPLATAADAKKQIRSQSDHVPAWASFRSDEDLDGDED